MSVCSHHGGTESEVGKDQELLALKFRSLVQYESRGKVEETSGLGWGGWWQENWLDLLRSVRPKGGGTQESEKVLGCPARLQRNTRGNTVQAASHHRAGGGLCVSPCEERFGGLATEAEGK